MRKFNFLQKIFNITFLFIIISASIQASNIKNSAVVFMYHKFDVSKYPSTNITLEQFESHLEELSKEKYNVKSIKYIVDAIINDKKLPDNTVGISIDDADRSFLETAWPRFKEKGFPITLFVTTGTIGNTKNYLSWDEIRLLKAEGVEIGAHSHTHAHLTTLSIEDLKEEIEKSNRTFLKEIDEIPSVFAYPYGEASEQIINLLDDYGFKILFGQHSGVINETSNFSYLPRFSLNEKYGDLDRFVFAANSKGLGVYDFIPKDPVILENPPFIGFSLLDQNLFENLNCFLFDNKGQIEKEIFKFYERIEIRLKRKISKGRARLNCTSKDNNDSWKWFGHQFYVPDN